MSSTVADLCARDHSSTLAARSLRVWGPESIALFVVGIPITWLIWRSAGVDTNHQAAAFVWILAATAGLGVFAQRRYAIALPWSALLISLMPVLQLLPHPFAHAPGIESIHQLFLAEGIPPPAQISIYPYATLQGSLVLAGCCALFALTRSLTTRSTRALFLIIATILAVGFVQSIIGFQQHLASQSLDNPASQFAHGTFVNRDHFAAFMEGCFGIAVGIALAALARRDWRRWLVGRESAFTMAALLVGTTCAAATIFSYSRMGILVLAAMASSVLLLTLIRNRRAALLLAASGAAAACAVSAAGLRGLTARFAELIAQHGDPGRLAMWRDTFRISPDFLWTGAGLGAFPFVFRRGGPYLPLKGIDHAHSDYLELLVELGLPGALLLFGCIAYVVVHSLWKLTAIHDPARRWTAFGCLLGTAGILLHAAADFPLHIPAVAATAAVLLGCARGLAVPVGCPPRVRQVASVSVMAGIAIIGLLLIQGHWGRLDAASLSRQAHASGIQGLHEKAGQTYSAALAANPFAAAAWIARAELAEIQAQPEEALQMMRIAATLEPFTLRTEWALANLLMRQRKHHEAALHFGTLAASIPAMRATVIEAASAGGISPHDIATDIVPPDGEAAGEFLIHLVREQAWPQLVPSYEALPSAAKRSISAHLLRYVFDQVFAAGQTATYLQLWKEMPPGPVPEGIGDPRGYGLHWAVRPLDGVAIYFGAGDQQGPAIEVRFTKSQNVHFAHLSRDFAVAPGRRYVLEAQIRTQDLTSSEGVRLRLASPRGSVIESKPFRRSSNWTQVRMPFRAAAADHVLRLVVIRYLSNRLDNEITGSVFVKDVKIAPATNRSG
ncbi:MAG: O-antigen ligase family protein [Acidobacteria bacterium]|nr:O-antigen ligase family protein [Acidobacteriota bacterium]